MCKYFISIRKFSFVVNFELVLPKQYKLLYSILLPLSSCVLLVGRLSCRVTVVLSLPVPVPVPVTVASFVILVGSATLLLLLPAESLDRELVELLTAETLVGRLVGWVSLLDFVASSSLN